MSTWLADARRPESLAVFTATASRSSGRPAVGEYLWNLGSAQARWAASTMYWGVGKSGSPTPKPITGRPAARSALALASTARVADSAMAATRADTRRCCVLILDIVSPPSSGPRLARGCEAFWSAVRREALRQRTLQHLMVVPQAARACLSFHTQGSSSIG